MAEDISIKDYNSISFTKIGIAFRDNKIVLYRRDRDDCPHLTISWNIKSGMIDLHFTTESNVKEYESLHQADQEKLLDGIKLMIEEIESFLLLHHDKIVNKFRFGWLKRNGYCAMISDIDDFNKAIVKQNKKKIYMDFGKLLTGANIINNITDDFGNEHFADKMKLILNKKTGKIFPVLSCDQKRRSMTCLNEFLMKKINECFSKLLTIGQLDKIMPVISERLKLDELQIDMPLLSENTDLEKVI